ncbi:MAG: type IV pilin protein [Vicinamibacterales bacterium]
MRNNEAGFTLIDLIFVVAIIGVVCAIAVPALLRARVSAQAGSAIADLRVLNSSQLSYAITCGSGFYAPDMPTLGVPPPASTVGFLSMDLAGAVTVIKSGYSITMSGTAVAAAPASCNGLAPGAGSPAYKAGADMITPNPQQRFFATNAQGVIYEDTASMFAAMPESGVPGTGVPIQ